MQLMYSDKNESVIALDRSKSIIGIVSRQETAIFPVIASCNCLPLLPHERI